jgi:hypothetical protein
MLLLCLPGVAAAGDLWRDKFDQGDAAFRGGNGYADHPDSGSLAWGESYLLHGYMTMYGSYGDTRYLDKLVAHVDQMMANLSDPDGDGYLGWQTERYSREKAANGGFETADASSTTLPQGWQRWQASEATAYRSTSTGAFHAGAAGLVVKTNGTSWQVMEQVLAGGYQPGAHYEVSFYGKTNGVVGGRVDVMDVTTDTRLGSVIFTNTGWSPQTFLFRAPAVSGHTLKVRCYHSAYSPSGGVAMFDEVSVKMRAEFVVHDGVILTPIARFIRAVYADPALSAYRAKADSYLAILQGFFAKWEPAWRELGGSPAQGLYVIIDPDSFSGSAGYVNGSSLPHNQYLAFARLLLELYHATNNTTYLDRAVKMGNAFKARVGTNASVPTAYVWNYADVIVSADSGRRIAVEDTSHGNIDVGASLDLYHAARVMTGANMRAFTSTLMDVMWNRSFSSSHFGDRVNTQAGTDYGRILIDWVRLSELDGDVWQAIAPLFRNVPADTTLELGLVANLADWNPERAPNRDFEWRDSADATLPARWQRWQSTAQTAYRSTASGDHVTGRAGLVVKTDGAKWQVAETSLAYTPGNTYQVTFQGKTNGVVGGRVDVMDATTNTVLGVVSFTGTAWTGHGFSFTAPAVAGHTVKLRCLPSAYTVVGGSAHFDSIQVTSP